jgi:hypothetical protein
MTEYSASTYVSLAYRYGEFTYGVGGNWRISLSVKDCDGEDPDLTAHLHFVKSALDHSSLWQDLPEFKSRPSTLENVSLYMANQVFSRSLKQGSWSKLTIFESEHLACEVQPGSKQVVLIFKQNNLHLFWRGDVDPQTGIAVDRKLITQEVIKTLSDYNEPQPEVPLQAWAQTLFNNLRSRIAGLTQLRIDLTRHTGIVAQTSSLI